MKTLLTISIIIIVLVTLTQIYVAMAGNKTETQAYTLIKKEADFEIRYYPVVTLAVVKTHSSSYKELGNMGFRKLAGYIFGGNNEKKQIAMTSPVHMQMSDSVATMAFVLPKNYNIENLPKPNDSSIEIKTTTAEYVAAIEFGGFSNTEKIQEHIAQLKVLLLKKNIQHLDNFKYLGYNPPYQLFGRKNEIIVTIIYSEINN